MGDRQDVHSELPARDGLDFDGDRDFVLLPSVQFDGIPPWTIEAIVIPIEVDMISGFSSLVSCAESGGISLESRSKKWAIDLFTADVRKWHRGTSGLGVWQETYSGALSNETIELGRLQHIAGVWNGKELRIYVDGKLHDRRTGVEICSRLSHAPFYLGADPCDFPVAYFDDGNFRGRMRAARISRAAEYEGSFTKNVTLDNTPETVGLYDFTRDSGMIALDWSGNGNHGVIVGAKFAAEGSAP